jgi:hypothetical protein
MHDILCHDAWKLEQFAARHQLGKHSPDEENAFPVTGATCVATQWCSKHIPAAVKQHATIGDEVLSVGAAPRLYNEDHSQLELELSVWSCHNNWEETATKYLGRAKIDFIVCCSDSETIIHPLPGYDHRRPRRRSVSHSLAKHVDQW